MLNASELNKLLSQNSDNKLFKCWFIMTPNGTLMAYTHPTAMKELRRQAALASVAWRESLEARLKREEITEDGSTLIAVLHTLTIETETENLIVRLLQTQMLLVLEGGVPPGKYSKETRTTAEGPDDLRYPTEDAEADLKVAGSMASLTGSFNSKASITTLQVQRKKLDAMATAIVEELERSGFQMPSGSGPKLF